MDQGSEEAPRRCEESLEQAEERLRLMEESVKGHLLNNGVRRVLSVDNSRRDVCNRGRDPLIGLDGVSPHAHDPATPRHRFRGLLRSIR